MTYRVVMDETAKTDLMELSREIAERSGDRGVAQKFVRELRSLCLELKSFPERGALPKDHLLVSLGCRFLAHKGYLIFYVTDKENRIVFIRAIQHERMNYTRQTLKLIDYSLHKLQEEIYKYFPD